MSGWHIVYIEGSQVILSKYMAFLSVNNGFIKANSADFDEMPRSAAFHLGLHWLQNYPVYKCIN